MPALARTLLPAAVVLILFFAPVASGSDLEQCRLEVTRTYVKASHCVGRNLSRALLGGPDRSEQGQRQFERRDRRILRKIHSDPVACGATPEHAAAVIRDLRTDLDPIERFSTGEFEILARNLSSPRRIACSPQEGDSLVSVAEAGQGGDTENPFYIAADGRPAFVENSGAVGRLNADLNYPRVREGLPSSAAVDEGGGFLDANGPNEIAFFSDGEMTIVMGLASNTETDEGCLVGELTGLPFTQNSARVYNISTEDEGDPIAAEGFTTIVDLSHDTRGDLFVLEYARRRLPGIFGLTPPLGGLIKVSPDGLRQQLGEAC